MDSYNLRIHVTDSDLRQNNITEKLKPRQNNINLTPVLVECSLNAPEKY